MPASERLLELVAVFRDNEEVFTSTKYNETQLRREFVDPLFELLGWDVANKLGHAEAYKDVVHEDSIRIGSATSSPDYCFRIGGTRKFFVEAKRPAVSLQSDHSAAYQIRRYAWSAKLPVAILTNFREYAVYDCRKRPSATDGPSAHRVMYIGYEEYNDRWDEIAGVFSRSAVLKGAFDKYESDQQVKKGTQTVDEAFLAELDAWREALAKNIALRNPGTTVDELNVSVQRIIDRIVFLRICESRGIEDHGQLRNIASSKDCYSLLCKLFAKADTKYNSGLFYFKAEPGRPSTPDEFTQRLRIDDLVIKSMLSNLYYPESPYAFSALPADILGKVYEEFLGKTIRLTPKGQARIEDKPEVRKAGGVYYTPEPVVTYIVDQTLGLLLQGASPKQVSQLKLLDPACGSGSFLLVAYQRLLDWHRQWYVNAGPEKHAKGRSPALFQTAKGDWKLTIHKRKEILINNIFGVDIDSQAVEVTKLSLLLKVLEGEVGLVRNLDLFHERALPDLGRNVLAGNSLVDRGFLSSLSLQDMVSEQADSAGIQPFDWHKSFPEVFEQGGFDVVIGNPPYLSYAGRQSVELPGSLRRYFEHAYECSGWPTSHSFFIERSVRDLSSRFVAFIVPDQVGHLEGYQSLRGVVAKNSHLRTVRYWGEKVFKGVTTPALTFVSDKRGSGETLIVEADGSEIAGKLGTSEWFISRELDVLNRLKTNSFSVRPYVVDCGVRTTDAKAQVGELESAPKNALPCLEGKNFGRYWCGPPTKAVRLDRGDVFRSAEEKYAASEFVIRQTAAYPIVAPKRFVAHFRNSAHGLLRPPEPMDIRYLVGLLNSKVVRFAYVAATREAGQKAFPQVKLGALGKLPLRAIDWSSRADKAQHARVVELVQAVIDLHIRAERSPKDAALVRDRIAALDEHLDEVVFDLYKVTPQDRQVIETALAKTVAAPNFPSDGYARPDGPGVAKTGKERARKKAGAKSA